MSARPGNRLIGPLLSLAILGLAGTLLCAVGWYRAARSGGTLSPEERQRIVEEMLTVSPGVFETAWYEPAIGYTLRRGAQLTAWHDSFTANALGYRAPPPEKRPGSFRVLFVGDSWTYGMGVSRQESFPAVFERLADRHAGLDREVEAWTLALPGYNTLNQVAALWFFYPRLDPDAVVFCPTSNDNHSLARVLPNGSLTRIGITLDRFGDPHSHVYPDRYLESYRSQQRWLTAAAALADSTARLDELGVPVLHYFVARWRPAMVHGLVTEAGIEAPYLINPSGLTIGEWLNPPPVLHGTAEANRVYGAAVYRGLAELLGWPPPPQPDDQPEERVPYFERPPPDTDWSARWRQLRRRSTRGLPTRFRPSPEARGQTAGPINPETGLIGPGTTILIRRPEGVTQARVTVRRLPEPALDPLAVTVEIPSPSGGSRQTFPLPPLAVPYGVSQEELEAGSRHTLTLELPPDLPAGTALDIVITASRTVAAPDVLAARSLYVEAIDLE